MITRIPSNACYNVGLLLVAVQPTFQLSLAPRGGEGTSPNRLLSPSPALLGKLGTGYLRLAFYLVKRAEHETET